jgi:hypothetical protein
MSNCFQIAGMCITFTHILIVAAIAAYFFWMRNKASSPARIYVGAWDRQQAQQTGCQTSGNRPEVLTGYPGSFPTAGCALNL